MNYNRITRKIISPSEEQNQMVLISQAKTISDTYEITLSPAIVFVTRIEYRGPPLENQFLPSYSP